MTSSSDRRPIAERASRPPRRFSPLRVLLVVAALVCVAGVAGVLALQTVRVKALERVHAVSEQLGLELHLGDVAARWDASVQVRDFGIELPEARPRGVARVAARDLTAQFRIGALLSGSRRPASIAVSGVDFELRADSTDELKRWAQSLLARWRARRRPSSEEPSTTGPRWPEVEVRDIAGTLSVGPYELQVRAEKARVYRLADGEWAASNRSRIQWASAAFDVDLTARFRPGPQPVWAVRVVSHPPLTIQRETTYGLIRAQLAGVEWNSAGEVELIGVEVERPQNGDRVAAARVRVDWDTWPTPDWIIAPRLVTVDDASVEALGAEVGWRRVEVTLDTSDWEPHRYDDPELLAAVWQALTSVRVVDGSANAPRHGVDGTVRELDLVLHSGPGSAAERLRSIRVEEPTVSVLWAASSPADTPTWAPGDANDNDLGGDDLGGDDLGGDDLGGDDLGDDTEDKEPAAKSTARGDAKASASVGKAKAAADAAASWGEKIAPLWEFAGVAVEVRGGSLTIGGASADERFLLRGIDWKWVPARGSHGPRVEGAARLQDGTEGSAAVEFGANLAPDGTLMNVRIGTTGERLAQLLPELSPHLLAREGAELSLDMRVDRTESNSFRATVTTIAKGVGFEWWRIANAPVEDIDMELEFDATYDPATDHLQAQIPKLRLGKSTLRAEADIRRMTEVPDLRLRLTLPRTDCQDVFDSFPQALVPRLDGLRARGSVAFDLQLAVDLERPKELSLDLDGELETCFVTSMGHQVDLGILTSRQFVHRPVVDGQELDVRVGPGTKWWVPIAEIPDYVAMAAVATEDLDFFVHNGFKLSLIKRAIKLDLDRKRYVYGGSTISQQLVKNLFLSREKTLARKFEEAIITWQMEHKVSKARILELYLNCIEFGPDVYGVKMAAKHYFGKDPGDLTPLEGAFLAGNKPCPKCGYRQWAKGGLDARWQGRMRHIMKRLRNRGWISPEQYDEAEPMLTRFYYGGKGYVEPSGVRPRNANWRP